MTDYRWQQTKSDVRTHQEKFTVDWDNNKSQYVILYEGEVFAIINDVAALPDGFVSRVASHLFDSLVGRRSAMWEEQVIYGMHPRDTEHARLNGRRLADALMRQRQDEGVFVPRDITTIAPASSDAKTPGQIAYAADVVLTPCYSDGITPRRPWHLIGLGAQQQWEKKA